LRRHDDYGRHGREDRFAKQVEPIAVRQVDIEKNLVEICPSYGFACARDRRNRLDMGLILHQKGDDALA
jgi:hypothetical protein